MVKHTAALENEALELIKTSKNGILQSDLWKILGLDSREGSRLVLKLTKRGVIRREQVSINGRRTYRLFLVERKRGLDGVVINVSSLLDIPCLTCPYIDECGEGSFYDPTTCPLMEAWIQSKLTSSPP